MHSKGLFLVMVQDAVIWDFSPMECVGYNHRTSSRPFPQPKVSRSSIHHYFTIKFASLRFLVLMEDPHQSLVREL